MRHNPLHITKTHLRQIGDGKAAMIVAMRPEDFLHATTRDAAHMQQIIDEAQPMANYNRYAREGDNIIPPLLRIRITKSAIAGIYEGAPEWRGEVEAHEGRHRAASVLKEEPGTLMPVAILIRTDEREWKETVTPGDPWSAIYYAKLEHLPESMRGEFEGRTLYRWRMQPLYYRDPDGGKGPQGFAHVNLPLDVATMLREVRENPIPIELTPFTPDEVRTTVREKLDPFHIIDVSLWVSVEGLLRVGGNTLYSYAGDWQDNDWWLVQRAMKEGQWPGHSFILVGYIETAAFDEEDDGIIQEMFYEARRQGYYQHDDADLEDDWDREDHLDDMKSDLGITRGRTAYFVAQSRVNPKLHGMKLGAYLYTKAMDEVVKRGGVLISTGYGDRSEKASRLWRSGERKGGTLREHGYHTRSVAPAEDDPTYQMRHYTHTGKPMRKKKAKRPRRRVPRKRAKRKMRRNQEEPTTADIVRLEVEGITPTISPAAGEFNLYDQYLTDFIKGYRNRIEIAVGSRIEWDQVYGCGAYGCAFPVRHYPQLALKITSDSMEGPVTQAIMETGLDKTEPGLARIENIWRVPHLAYDDVVYDLYVDEVYVILRENVDPIEQRYRRIAGDRWKTMSPIPEAHHALIVFSNEVQRLYQQQRNVLYYEGLKRRVEAGDPEAIAGVQRAKKIDPFFTKSIPKKYLDVIDPTPTEAEVVQAVTKDLNKSRAKLQKHYAAVEAGLRLMDHGHETWEMGRALSKLMEKGIYLHDLHIGNVAFHAYEWVGGEARPLKSPDSLREPWCVFDYGASSTFIEAMVKLMPGTRDIDAKEVEALMEIQRQVRQNPALEDIRQRIKRL